MANDDRVETKGSVDIEGVVIPDDEQDIAEEFLSKFTIVSESSLN